MKQMIFVFAVLFWMLGCAQSPKYDAITVNNLQVGEHYTQEQFLQALGTPTKIVPPQEFDEYVNAYTYYFGEDRFFWIDGEFYGFDLHTSKFAVNGLIKIGDHISKIDLLEGIKKVRASDDIRLIDWCPDKGGLYDWLSVRFFYNENNTIVYIDAFINSL